MTSTATEADPTETEAATSAEEAQLIESVAEVLATSGASDDLAKCYADVLGAAGAQLQSLDELAAILADLGADQQTELQRWAPRQHGLTERTDRPNTTDIVATGDSAATTRGRLASLPSFYPSATRVFVDGALGGSRVGRVVVSVGT